VIDIRSVSVEDLIKDKNVFIELLRDSYGCSFPGKRITIDYCEKKIDELSVFLGSNKAILFAAFQNRLCGFVWAYISEAISEKRIHINHIALEKKFRRKSIGTALIKKIEDYADHNGIHVIELMVSELNIGAISFYKKNGFSTERYLLKKKLTGKNNVN
jgi:ribosomal protein S18 acetylase RimI-like enzyme